MNFRAQNSVREAIYRSAICSIPLTMPTGLTYTYEFDKMTGDCNRYPLPKPSLLPVFPTCIQRIRPPMQVDAILKIKRLLLNLEHNSQYPMKKWGRDLKTPSKTSGLPKIRLSCLSLDAGELSMPSALNKWQDSGSLPFFLLKIPLQLVFILIKTSLFLSFLPSAHLSLPFSTQHFRPALRRCVLSFINS